MSRYPYARVSSAVRRGWLKVALLILLVIGWNQYREWRIPPVVLAPLPPPEETPYVDWFQVVRVPDVITDRSTAREMKRNIEAWLEVLNADGFQIRSLSEIMYRLQQGQGVPAKTLALVFDPGYRFTYEMLTPLIRSENISAVWLTDSPGRYFPDRRFITGRERRKAATRYFWDVGLRGDDPLSFSFESTVVPLAVSTGHWAMDSGRYGINRSSSLNALNRLHANSTWAPQELLARLNAELPIEWPSYLRVQQIRGYSWGSVAPTNEPSAFNFKSESSRRTASVSWLGSLGQEDFRLSIRAKRLFGQLWFLLRSDRVNGGCVRVGFTGTDLAVEQAQDGLNARLANCSYVLGPTNTLQASLALEGSQLRIRFGTNEVVVGGIEVAGGPQGMLEMLTYDRVRGAGTAEGLELYYEPSPKQSISRQREPLEPKTQTVLK